MYHKDINGSKGDSTMKKSLDILFRHNFMKMKNMMVLTNTSPFRIHFEGTLGKIIRENMESNNLQFLMSKITRSNSYFKETSKIIVLVDIRKMVEAMKILQMNRGVVEIGFDSYKMAFALLLRKMSHFKLDFKSNHFSILLKCQPYEMIVNEIENEDYHIKSFDPENISKLEVSKEISQFSSKFILDENGEVKLQRIMGYSFKMKSIILENNIILVKTIVNRVDQLWNKMNSGIIKPNDKYRSRKNKWIG